MNITKIITLANQDVRLQFLAMERSLRATGSDLPIQVIPYNRDLFTLPDNAEWWEESEITAFLQKANAHPMMRKYQCLTASHYQYVDTDICFLKDPRLALQDLSGFVVCCGHWRSVEHACNDHSVAIFSKRSTTWQKSIFNAGQFACDRALFNVEQLIHTASSSNYKQTTLEWPHNDQPGLNLLVWASRVPITNLTLPPHSLESSWAGDYPAEFSPFWEEPCRKPYLMHWAGLMPDGSRPVDRIFFDFLTRAEQEEWKLKLATARPRQSAISKTLRSTLKKVAAVRRSFV